MREVRGSKISKSWVEVADRKSCPRVCGTLSVKKPVPIYRFSLLKQFLSAFILLFSVSVRDLSEIDGISYSKSTSNQLLWNSNALL
jgi:hypothetical protein